MSTNDRRWPIGLLIAFVVMIVVNGLFVWAAYRDKDDIVSSYDTEAR